MKNNLFSVIIPLILNKNFTSANVHAYSSLETKLVICDYDCSTENQMNEFF